MDFSTLGELFLTENTPIPQNPISAQVFPIETQVQAEDLKTALKVPARIRKNIKFRQFLAQKKEKKGLLKRKMDTSPSETAADDLNPATKARRLCKVINNDKKSAMQRLNELQMPYNLEVSEIPNCKLFRAAITMNEKLYEGVSSSKQDAKQKAALHVLEHVMSDVAGQELPGLKLTAVGDNQSMDVEGKTPVSIVNEMFGPGGWQVVSEQGADNNFATKISLGNYGEYIGNGRSKKQAKQMAALTGLLHILKIPSLAAVSSSQLSVMIHQFRLQGVLPPFHSENDHQNGSSAIVKHTVPLATSGAVVKSPLQILHEHFDSQSICFQFVNEEGQSNNKTFHVKLTVDGVEGEFVACGSSKQNAKQNAASLVLASLSINCPENADVEVSAEQEMAADDDNSSVPTPVPPVVTTSKRRSNAWADYVAQMVNRKFEELTHNTVWSKRTVLAGIVMTVGDNYQSTAQLICLATGTKGLSGSNLAPGSALIDCHAEVLVRRSLCRYFYSHLLAMDDTVLAANAIFEKNPNGDTPPFRLKPDFRFHLYISTAPCGDGRVYCLIDNKSKGSGADIDTNPNRINRGVLRTKIESGEGTVPSVEELEVHQTWDGILGGHRLLIGSCSDKIFMWNTLGLQGNLLSQFVEPIYLSSIIIASHFNYEHLRRALITRLAPYDVGQSRFTHHEPELFTTTKQEKRVPCSPVKHAMIWTVCDRAFEIVDCATGRLIETKNQSSVCKLTLYRLFDSVVSKFKLKVKTEAKEGDALATPSTGLTYRAAKEQNEQYDNARRNLLKAFQDQLLGVWPKKPIELELFTR